MPKTQKVTKSSGGYANSKKMDKTGSNLYGKKVK